MTKRKNPYDPVYVSIRDNISIENAKLKIEKFKSDKATSRVNFIKKYGIDDGNKRFDEFKNRTLAVGYALAKTEGANRSKFSKQYWIKRGHSEIESIELAKSYQHHNSPLHVLYWTTRGFSENDALTRIKNIHTRKIGNKNLKSSTDKDSMSLLGIKRKYPLLSEEQVIDKQMLKLNTIRVTMERKGRWIPVSELSDYNRYRRLVALVTKRNIQYLDITNRGRIGTPNATNIDHIYSILRGFLDGINPEIIGSIHNLRVIDAVENVKKQENCAISKQELLEKYYENKKYT